ncbi:MAG: hypothetical protein IMY76_07965 [Chloroflexi bacterium]|nr:hypothetical protein [Chloroflexota bacterium]
MTEPIRPDPIFTTSGDVGAFLIHPFIYSLAGEWAGWVTQNKDVYSVIGNYIGYLSDDNRILRKRSYDYSNPRITPPPPQPRVRVPSLPPLPPMMAELPFTIIDVLDYEPHRLSTIDHDDLREDMD